MMRRFVNGVARWGLTRNVSQVPDFVQQAQQKTEKELADLVATSSVKRSSPARPVQSLAKRISKKVKQVGKEPVKLAKEIGGPSGPEPTRFNDWERNGRVSDF